MQSIQQGVKQKHSIPQLSEMKQDLHGSTGNHVGLVGECFLDLQDPWDLTWDLLEFMSMEKGDFWKYQIYWVIQETQPGKPMAPL